MREKVPARENFDNQAEKSVSRQGTAGGAGEILSMRAEVPARENIDKKV
jgi:hypothetical protein